MGTVTVRQQQHDLFVEIIRQLPRNFREIVATKPTSTKLLYMTTREIKHIEEAERITRLAYIWHALWNYCYIYNSQSNTKRTIKQEERPSRQPLKVVRVPKAADALNEELAKGRKLIQVTPEYTPGSGKPRIQGQSKLVWEVAGLADVATEIVQVAEGQEGLIEKQYNETLAPVEQLVGHATQMILGNREDVRQAQEAADADLLRGEQDVTKDITRPIFDQVEQDRLLSHGCEHCHKSPAKCTCGNPVDNDRPVEFLDAEYAGFSDDESRLSELLERRVRLHQQEDNARMAALDARDVSKFVRKTTRTLVTLNKKWSIYRLLAGKQAPGSNEELEHLGECAKIERREYGLKLALEDPQAACEDAYIRARCRQQRAHEQVVEANAEIMLLTNKLNGVKPVEYVQTQQAKDERNALYVARVGKFLPTHETVLRNWLSVICERLDKTTRDDVATFRKLEKQYDTIARHIDGLHSNSYTQKKLAILAARLICARASMERPKFAAAVAAYKAAAA